MEKRSVSRCCHFRFRKLYLNGAPGQHKGFVHRKRGGIDSQLDIRTRIHTVSEIRLEFSGNKAGNTIGIDDKGPLAL